ncbi:hypothetical protein ACXG8O_002937 [Citrobacter youngae]
MSKIARYQGNVRAFASDAQGLERTVFGGTNQADDLTSQITASFLRGWGIVGASEHPSLEDFNAAMYAMSQFIAYQHQMGIPEWHAEQEYHLGSICTHNGESYQSLQNANVGSQPPSAKWTPVLTSKNGLANLGLVDASGIVGRLVNIQVISSTRQYVPTTGARRIISILTGGGAGGAPANAATTSQIYSGGGGGAGGTAIGVFTLSAISNFLVTVGSGGASNNAGGNSTAFGMTARGGLPGTNNVGTSSSAGGFGSDSSGGLINLSGGDGSDGQAATRLVGGTGGSSFWGGSGRSGSGNGANGKAPGSGGGGARDDQLSGTAYTGGVGADGICVILELA